MKRMNLIIVFIFCVTFSMSQNVGIGTSAPDVPLHIKGTSGHMLKIEGNLPYLSLFDINAGYRGYLWYNGSSIQVGTAAGSNLPVSIAPNVSATATFLPNGNVGIGTTTPSAKLEVNGSVKVTDGTQGANKVLTSDAAGNATWQSTSFTSADRFLITYSISAGTATYTTKYNNGTAFSITNETVTINKTGLYHFESAASLQTIAAHDYSQQAANPQMLELRLIVTSSPNIGNNVWFLLDMKPFFKFTAAGTYSLTHAKGSQDLYIQAPATLDFIAYTDNSTLFSTVGYTNYISGYLISQ